MDNQMHIAHVCIVTRIREDVRDWVHARRDQNSTHTHTSRYYEVTKVEDVLYFTKKEYI